MTSKYGPPFPIEVFVPSGAIPTGTAATAALIMNLGIIKAAATLSSRNEVHVKYGCQDGLKEVSPPRVENQSVTSTEQPVAATVDGQTGWIVKIYALDVKVTFYE